MLFLSLYATVSADTKFVCPLWHVEQLGKCNCVSTLEEHIRCNDDTLLVYSNVCLTWDNQTDSICASYCLCPPMDHALCREGYYEISSKLSGPELNEKMCGKLNRQGAHCKQCIGGYGHSVLSDGVSCADCSKHNYMWLLNLLFQLLLLTLMFILIIVLRIKGTASPWNIVITYSQLIVNALMYDAHYRNRIDCFIGNKVRILLITILGVSNLDFLRLVIPPLCVSTSLRAINTFFFDYIIALYPILMTVLLYILIKLHDRNCKIVVILSLPIRNLYCHHCGRWDPKQSILSTFATFLLLSYSKLLFVSCNFLFAVQSYSSSGHLIPNSTVLLYDPTVSFFHSQHTPYIIIALLVITTFILLPLIFLLLYPTRLFRKKLTCCGFRRWDILHMIMDTFQGWYKDGTEGTYDYRPLSALYMLLRIGLVGEFLTLIHLNLEGSGGLKWFVTGSLHLFLGSFFLMVKPYKKQWMNVADGLILKLIGFICCIHLNPL